MIITLLRIVFSVLLIWICFITVTTGLHEGFYAGWRLLGAMPWMEATLWGVYINVIVIYLWIWYREKSLKVKLLWFVFLAASGGIGSCTYVLIQLAKLKPEEGFNELFAKKAA